LPEAKFAKRYKNEYNIEIKILGYQSAYAGVSGFSLYDRLRVSKGALYVSICQITQMEHIALSKIKSQTMNITGG